MSSSTTTFRPQRVLVSDVDPDTIQFRSTSSFSTTSHVLQAPAQTRGISRALLGTNNNNTNNLPSPQLPPPQSLTMPIFTNSAQPSRSSFPDPNLSGFGQLSSTPLPTTTTTATRLQQPPLPSQYPTYPTAPPQPTPVFNLNPIPSNASTLNHPNSPHLVSTPLSALPAPGNLPSRLTTVPNTSSQPTSTPALPIKPTNARNASNNLQNVSSANGTTYTSRRIPATTTTTTASTTPQPTPSLSAPMYTGQAALNNQNFGRTGTTTTTTTTTPAINAFNRPVATKPKPIPPFTTNPGQQQDQVLGIFGKGNQNQTQNGSNLGSGGRIGVSSLGGKQSILTLQDEYNSLSRELKQLKVAYAELQVAYDQSNERVGALEREREGDLVQIRTDYENQIESIKIDLNQQIAHLTLELVQNNDKIMRYEAELTRVEDDWDRTRDDVVEEVLQLCEVAGFDRVEMTRIINFQHPSTAMYSPETRELLERVRDDFGSEAELVQIVHNVLQDGSVVAPRDRNGGGVSGDEDGDGNSHDVLRYPSRLQLVIDQLIQSAGKIGTSTDFERKTKARMDEIETLQIKSDEIDDKLAKNFKQDQINHYHHHHHYPKNGHMNSPSHPSTQSHFPQQGDEYDSSMEGDSFIFGSGNRGNNGGDDQHHHPNPNLRNNPLPLTPQDPESLSDNYVDSIQSDYIKLNKGLYKQLAALGLVRVDETTSTTTTHPHHQSTSSKSSTHSQSPNPNPHPDSELDLSSLGLLNQTEIALLGQFLTDVHDQDNKLDRDYHQNKANIRSRSSRWGQDGDGIGDLTTDLFNLDITIENGHRTNAATSTTTSTTTTNPSKSYLTTTKSNNNNGMGEGTGAKAELAERLNQIAWLLDLPPVAQVPTPTNPHGSSSTNLHHDQAGTESNKDKFMDGRKNQQQSVVAPSSTPQPRDPLDNYFAGINYGDFGAIMTKLTQLQHDLVQLGPNVTSLSNNVPTLSSMLKENVDQEQTDTLTATTTSNPASKAPQPLPESQNKTQQSSNPMTKSVHSAPSPRPTTTPQPDPKKQPPAQSQPTQPRLTPTTTTTTTTATTTQPQSQLGFDLDQFDIKPPKSHQTINSSSLNLSITQRLNTTQALTQDHLLSQHKQQQNPQSSSIFNTSLTSILSSPQRPNQQPSTAMNDGADVMDQNSPVGFDGDNAYTDLQQSDPQPQPSSRLRAHSPLRDFTARIKTQHMSPQGKHHPEADVGSHSSNSQFNNGQNVNNQNGPFDLGDFDPFAVNQTRSQQLQQPIAGGFSPRHRQQQQQQQQQHQQQQQQQNTINTTTTTNISNTNVNSSQHNSHNITPPHHDDQFRPHQSSVPTLITTTITPIKKTPIANRQHQPLEQHQQQYNQRNLPNQQQLSFGTTVGTTQRSNNPNINHNQDNSFNLNGSTSSSGTTTTPTTTTPTTTTAAGKSVSYQSQPPPPSSIKDNYQPSRIGDAGENDELMSASANLTIPRFDLGGIGLAGNNTASTGHKKSHEFGEFGTAENNFTLHLHDNLDGNFPNTTNNTQNHNHFIHTSSYDPLLNDTFKTAQIMSPNRTIGGNNHSYQSYQPTPQHNNSNNNNKTNNNRNNNFTNSHPHIGSQVTSDLHDGTFESSFIMSDQPNAQKQQKQQHQQPNQPQPKTLSTPVKSTIPPRLGAFGTHTYNNKSHQQPQPLLQSQQTPSSPASSSSSSSSAATTTITTIPQHRPIPIPNPILTLTPPQNNPHVYNQTQPRGPLNDGTATNNTNGGNLAVHNTTNKNLGSPIKSAPIKSSNPLVNNSPPFELDSTGIVYSIDNNHRHGTIGTTQYSGTTTTTTTTTSTNNPNTNHQGLNSTSGVQVLYQQPRQFYQSPPIPEPSPPPPSSSSSLQTFGASSNTSQHHYANLTTTANTPSRSRPQRVILNNPTQPDNPF